MKKLYLLLFSILLVTSSSHIWAQDDLQIVTGEHWVKSSLEQKRAYLFGVGNMLEIEQAMIGDNYKSMSGKSIIPTLLDGLSGVSIANLVKQLDLYYSQHPKQNKRAVIEVLYIEMASPNLTK
jgi:hypothetical protein